MDKRLFSFFILSAIILFGSQILLQKFFPPPPKPVAQKPPEKKADEKKADEKAPEKAAEKKPEDVKPGEAAPAANADAPAAVAAPAKFDQQWPTLGSLDPDGDYRMFVTFNSRGASVERVELNNPRYHEVDNLNPVGGYLGNLAVKDHTARVEGKDGKTENGVLAQVVGPGTPAALAGIQVNDVITSVIDLPTPDVASFQRAMVQTNPNTKVKVALLRDGKPQTVEVELRRHPLQLISPAYSVPGNLTISDQLSFLMTLQQVGEDELPQEGADKERLKKLTDDELLKINAAELKDVDLLTANWELLPKDAAKPDEVAFRRVLPGKQVEVIKRFSLDRRDKASKADTAQAYTLNMRLELKNTAKEPRRLAYRLDGPTGLPVEGFWYSRDSKIGLVNGCGVRDITFGTIVDKRVDDAMITCTQIVDKKYDDITDKALKYVGVDALYFTAALLPQLEDPSVVRFSRMAPIQVGRTIKNNKNETDTAQVRKTDVSFQLTSVAKEAAPDEIIGHDFKVFLGPKVPSLLAENGLKGQIDYGWFDWIAEPMLFLLHTFYGWVGNYGIAIIMLTVVVRSCMFPISRKQAINAVKMQELQPELKKIAEKYKGKREEQARAQQELWKKHNYHPLSGCLPVFLQLPIFVGLYNSLKVDVELRQAPLISENIRWASNLAAPDMFWKWQQYLPTFLGGEEGYLGPFLNLLPLITISLFLIQQKLFMPPATDEQTAMQQKMIKYMMFFMAFMFFKVPAGLCVYFITSSIWSICEKQFLPKAKPAPMAGATLTVEATKQAEPAKKPSEAGGNGKKSKRR